MRWVQVKPDLSVRLFLFLYLIAFLAGAIAGNQIWRIESFRDYIAGYITLEQTTGGYGFRKYALFLLREKGLFTCVCILAGLAGAGETLAVISALWLGFLGGGLSVLFLLEAGIRDFLICMCGIFQQLIFYIPTIILFLLVMGKYKRMLPHRGKLAVGESKWLVIFCLLFIVAEVGGILVEACVNSQAAIWLLF